MDKNITSYITGITQVAQVFGSTLTYTAPTGGGVYMLSQSYYGAGTVSISNNASGKSYFVINYRGNSGTAALVVLFGGDTITFTGGGNAKQCCKLGTLPPKFKYTATSLKGWHTGNIDTSSAYRVTTSYSDTKVGHVYLEFSSTTWHSWWTAAYISGYTYLKEHTDSNWSNNGVGVTVPTSDGQTISIYNDLKSGTNAVTSADHWIYELTAEEEILGFFNGYKIPKGYFDGRTIVKVDD